MNFKSLVFKIKMLARKFLGKPYDVERYWTERGKFYRKIEEAKRTQPLDQIERLLLQVLNGQDFNSVLDFGCGYGKHLKVLAQTFKNKRLVGIDVSSSMLKQAENYVSGNVELKKTDGLTLPFGDKSFDVTYTCHVLIHNPPENIERIVEEIKRVTRKFSVHIESTVKSSPCARHYFCHNYDSIFKASGGEPQLLYEFGNQGKVYLVKWRTQ